MFTTINYGFNDWDMSLRWRHLPEAKSALQAALDSTTATSPVLGAEDAYDVFDLAVSWNMNERSTLRLGMDNIFDDGACHHGCSNASRSKPDDGPGYDGGGVLRASRAGRFTSVSTRGSKIRWVIESVANGGLRLAVRAAGTLCYVFDRRRVIVS